MPPAGTGPIRVLLTHPGTQYSYKLAEQLERLGMLYAFTTGFALGQDNQWLKWLPKSWQKKLERRKLAVPQKRLFTFPFLELKALRKIRRGGNSEQVFFERNRRFQQKIPQKLLDNATVIIGFDTSSWILVERCRRAGKPFILDASIAHPLSQQAVFSRLRERFPLWRHHLHQKPQPLMDMEQQEMQQADAIVVASQFTRNTYLQHGVDAGKIYINHYGTDFQYFTGKWEGSAAKDGPGQTRFLFFSKLSVRKGFPWLCEIWSSFHKNNPNARLVSAGYGHLPQGFEIPEGTEVHGFVHPADRLELFHAADVFVFPSYFEGFAQVIIEAMACGLPVITTTATIGPEVITDGVEGFCIEPGDDEALYNALQFFMDHPGRVEPMGRAAGKRVEPMTWEAYGQRWKEICEQVMASRRIDNPR